MGGIDGGFVLLQAGMTKTDAASQTLAEINPDVILEVGICQLFCVVFFNILKLSRLPTCTHLKNVTNQLPVFLPLALNSYRTKGLNVRHTYTIFTKLAESYISILYINWFETLSSTLSYVKEKLKIYLHVTRMIKILSMWLHPRAWVF